jgi:DNA-binding NarL/FixJ family response regulator
MVVVVRSQLGEPAFAEAKAQGRSLTAAQALASRETFTPQVQPPQLAQASQDSFSAGLTPRENKVLRLLATGLTSAQIAEQLIISVLTVNGHIRSIYSKMGVTSRSAATRYAIEHKLV